MSGEQNEVLLKGNFNVKQEKWLLGLTSIEVTVNPQQIVSSRLLLLSHEVPHQKILMKWVNFELHLLIFLQKHLHLNYRVQVKNIKHLQVLPALNQNQKLFTISRQQQRVFQQLECIDSLKRSLGYVFALGSEGYRGRVLHQDYLLFKYRRN